MRESNPWPYEQVLKLYEQKRKRSYASHKLLYDTANSITKKFEVESIIIVMLQTSGREIEMDFQNENAFKSFL